MKIYRMLLVMMIALAGIVSASAQTSDLGFVQVTNDGTHYDVTVQIKASSSFNLGLANLVFTYNNADLSNPTILSTSNFSGGNYQPINLAVTPPRVSVNIELNSTPGTAVQTASFMDVVTIRFTIVNKNGTSSLAWFPATGTTGTTVIFKDDNTSTVNTSSLVNLNTSPLPIQLSNFFASNAAPGQASLRWTTLSEINNYGFEVQKSVDKSGEFQSISGAFIAGNGTSVVKHDYSYVDNAYQSGNVYRLKQVDLTGATHFTDVVDPLGVTGVSIKPVPTVYSLSQNYPNPFNPSTTIEFALPQDSHVQLDVYNILGQKVMTLLNEVRQTGYHSVRLDGTNLASGVYLYRLSAGTQTFMKKFILMK